MKGLLLKDLYMLRAYCKSYVLIIAVFLAVSFAGENMFFIYYPCLLCGMIPVNLLSYDERSHFMQYSVSLPVSRTQAVSEKYLVGLISQAAVLLITGIVQAIRMNMNGSFAADEFSVMMLSLLLVSMLTSSFPLPIVFKNGVEKARITYYFMIGIVGAAGMLFSKVFKGEHQSDMSAGAIFAALAVVGICMYILSWYMSVWFYKKREL